MPIYEQILNRAESIFINSETYSYDDLINGNVIHIQVTDSEGNNHEISSDKEMFIIDSNTVRAFHRINKQGIGPKEIFDEFFIANKEDILKKLIQIATVEDTVDNLRSMLNYFENEICNQLRLNLEQNTKRNLLYAGNSPIYNKIRKPLDIFIEHIVIMSNELRQYKNKLLPILFLPLDSQIFSTDFIFSEDEFNGLDLQQNLTFGDFKELSFGKLKYECDYDIIQNFLYNKAVQITQNQNRQFYRIYFDLAWGNRLNNKFGKNLFQSSLKYIVHWTENHTTKNLAFIYEKKAQKLKKKIMNAVIYDLTDDDQMVL